MGAPFPSKDVMLKFIKDYKPSDAETHWLKLVNDKEKTVIAGWWMAVRQLDYETLEWVSGKK